MCDVSIDNLNKNTAEVFIEIKGCMTLNERTTDNIKGGRPPKEPDLIISYGDPKSPFLPIYDE
jgi:hypothetical protein